jgi:hypothetical protein
VILFVHLATSDFFKRGLPLTDPSQPWIVAIAAELADIEGHALDFVSTRVRAAPGRKIREGAEARHGITSREAAKTGISEIVALGMLCGLAAQARFVVGHGIEFDRLTVESVLLRSGKDARLWMRPGLESLDTMTSAAPFCRIKANPPRDDGQFKWPSLDDACHALLGEPKREPPLDLWESVQRTKRLFLHLRSLNAYELAA